MKKFIKSILRLNAIYVFALLGIFAIMGNEVYAHSLEPWSKIYTPSNAGGDHQFAIMDSYHVAGDTVNYCWSNENVKSRCSSAFNNAVRQWGGLIKANEVPSDESIVEIKVKHDPDATADDYAAYVNVYKGNGHYTSAQNSKTEMVIIQAYNYDYNSMSIVLAHELGHLWGIDDLYKYNDQLDSIYSRPYAFSEVTRHDKNAMRICLNKPWFDTGNGYKYQKSPGVWANNEWLNISGTDYYFKGNIKTTAYKIKYNSNGGTGAPSMQTKIYNETLTLSSSKPTKKYTVRFDANGGNSYESSRTVNPTFKNWNTNIEGTGNSYTSGATYSENVSRTLYAQWTNPSVGILPNAYATDKVFKGWYTSKTGGTKITASTKVTGNVTYYAQWIDIINMNSGTSYNNSINTAGDKVYYKFVPTTSGVYRFYTTGGSDTVVNLYGLNLYKLSYDDDSGANRNCSLVYYLEKGRTYYYEVGLYGSRTGAFNLMLASTSGKYYNVYYNMNSSFASNMPPTDHKVDAVSMTLPELEPVRYGYVFLGWSSDKSAKIPTYYKTNGTYNAKYTNNSSVTLYAIWGLLGDVNRDGKLDLRDSQLALKFALGSETPDIHQKKVMDYNKDGKADLTDAKLIQKAALGIN